MHATVFSGSICGVEGFLVEVEVDISRGIPSFSIVGLPNTAVRESRERVTAAIKNLDWEFPLERITVNLAPADIKKEGAAFDLAIAVGILVCSEQVESPELGQGQDSPRTWPFGRTIFLGELALDGSMRKVRGVLPVLLHARARGFESAVIPSENFHESLVVSGIEVFGCRHLREVVGIVSEKAGGGMGGGGGTPGDPPLWKGVGERRIPSPESGEGSGEGESEELDLSDVLGQECAKRALVVAAAGGHHVLMVGPPGAGKTMLARRFPSLLPPLDEEAALETTMIYSIMGLLDGSGLLRHPPFRSPHHSASDAGLIGGGNTPHPGEVTLAHNGVLFLDELPEFKRHVLETLREPLEEGRITISRARQAVTFPARFQLVAAMNPCPCGYLGSREHQCRCTPPQVEKYLGKISGPLLDRISIHVFIRPVELAVFQAGSFRESGCSPREEVIEARARQRRRFGEEGGGRCNAQVPEKVFKRHCIIERAAEELLFRAQKQLRISARGRGHILRVARTIADLERVERIASHHVAEAIQYRIRELPV